MRASTYNILILAALCCLAPVASARSRKSAPKPSHASAKHTRKVVKEAPKASRGKHTHVHEEPVEAPRLTRTHGHHKPATAPSHTTVARLSRPAPVVRSQPSAGGRPEVQTAPEQETIHVTHDRKQHLSPPASDHDARKATPEDFLTVGAASREPAVRPALRIEEPQAPVIVADDADTRAAFSEPALYNKRGRLIMPPALKGSHEILLRQNQVADSDGLNRIKDDNDLEQMRSNKILVALPVGAGIQTDERLPLNRRYCRPWTAVFLTELARAHYARFHTPLQINSAVRTVEFQQKLLRTNGNAAPAGGETASPHLTGQAVDLAKHGLSMTEIAWLRGYLLPLVQEGKVDVEEEFQQACFHISVYKKYLPQSGPRREIPTRQRGGATALAVALP